MAGEHGKSDRVLHGDLSQSFVQNFDSPWSGYGPFAWLGSKLRTGLYQLSFWGLSHPWAIWGLRQWFGLLRRVMPIAKIGNSYILTRYGDVKQVLERMDTFSSADAMKPRMPAGPFVLSIDWMAQHERELDVLRSAMAPFVDFDSKRISKWARQSAQSALLPVMGKAQQGDHRGFINIAEDYCEETALYVIEQYFGIEASLGGGTRQQLRMNLRVLAAQIFTPPLAWSEVQGKTADAAASLVDCLMANIKTKSVEGSLAPEDCLLTRLHKLAHQQREKSGDWLDDHWICRLVAGMMVAGNATVARAQTQAIYQIMQRREALGMMEKATHAFKAIERDVNEAALRSIELSKQAVNRLAMARGQVLRIMYEGLRFNPMLPVLSPRLCLRDTIIGRNTPNSGAIKAGDTVLPFVLSAMFDQSVFEDPNRFKDNRPLANYLHFGWGPHMCFGKFVADTQFVENAVALFGRDDFAVRRTSLRTIKYEGPAVAEYWLEVVRT